MWLVSPKQNAYKSCKLDHAISFNLTVRLGNWVHCRDRENLKIIFMVCNEWINACNAIMNFGYMNGHSSHLPWLDYGCKIECLQYEWVYSSEIIPSCWKLHHLQLLHLKSQVSKSIFKTHSLTILQNCVRERVSRGHL